MKLALIICFGEFGNLVIESENPAGLRHDQILKTLQMQALTLVGIDNPVPCNALCRIKTLSPVYCRQKWGAYLHIKGQAATICRYR